MAHGGAYPSGASSDGCAVGGAPARTCGVVRVGGRLETLFDSRSSARHEGCRVVRDTGQAPAGGSVVGCGRRQGRSESGFRPVLVRSSSGLRAVFVRSSGAASAAAQLRGRAAPSVAKAPWENWLECVDWRGKSAVVIPLPGAVRQGPGAREWFGELDREDIKAGCPDRFPGRRSDSLAPVGAPGDPGAPVLRAAPRSQPSPASLPTRGASLRCPRSGRGEKGAGQEWPRSSSVPPCPAVDTEPPPRSGWSRNSSVPRESKTCAAGCGGLGITAASEWPPHP